MNDKIFNYEKFIDGYKELGQWARSLSDEDLEFLYESYKKGYPEIIKEYDLKTAGLFRGYLASYGKWIPKHKLK